MWSVTNRTPYAAERCWVRDKNGAEVWLVAVKGTFLIGPDGVLRKAYRDVSPKTHSEEVLKDLATLQAR